MPLNEKKFDEKKIIQVAQLIQKYTQKTWSCFSERSSRDFGGKIDRILKDEEDIKWRLNLKDTNGTFWLSMNISEFH